MSATVDQATPSPAPELAELAFFIGAWEADGTFHATPFSSEKPIAMRIDVELLHRGFWMRTRTAEQPSPDNPNPLTATYLWGYDPEAGRFSADWFDSNGGRATQTSPAGKATAWSSSARWPTAATASPARHLHPQRRRRLPPPRRGRPGPGMDPG